MRRKGMGLIEYQTMPSLHDIAHDGLLLTFTILRQQLEIPSARSWPAPVRITGTVRKRLAVRPVHQNHTCRVTLLQPAGGPPCWASPLAFGPIGFNIEKYTVLCLDYFRTVFQLFLYYASTMFVLPFNYFWVLCSTSFVLCFNYFCTGVSTTFVLCFNYFFCVFKLFWYRVQLFLGGMGG
jgi:hypothetical protein